MMGLDNPIHIAFLLILLLLVFGAKRLPEMGRSLGTGMRGFKDSIGGEAPVRMPRASPQHSRADRRSRTTPRRRGASRAARPLPRPEPVRVPVQRVAGRRPRAPLQEPGAPSRRLTMAVAVGSIGHEDRLHLVGHLEELRVRLIVSLAALAIAFGFCMWQNHALLRIINKPLAHQTQKQVRAGHGPLGATYTVQQDARMVATQLQVVVGALERPGSGASAATRNRWRA